MYAATFDYYRPKDLKDAMQLLRKHKDAVILAGGHSLLPAMKLRVSSPSALVDIGRIKGLSGIRISGTSAQIGAMTTHATIAASKELSKACPILADTAAQIGDLQVRNRGTIGGSLAHADPAADFPTVIVALGAKVIATGSRGKRQIPAEKFFRDLFTTALKPAEVLTSVQVPTMRPGMGGVYLKHRHPASSYAVVGVAAVVAMKNGVFSKARLVVGGTTPNPVVVVAAEKVLVGKSPTAETISAAAAKVAGAIGARFSDTYASAEYRAHLATVLAQRALTQAAARAKRNKS
jgi:carbon-monoxide dehydrogenase medium subunit